MKPASIFTRRSARCLAIGRLAFAFLYMVSTWVAGMMANAPAGSTGSTGPIGLALASPIPVMALPSLAVPLLYLLVAAALLAIAWIDVWLDCRVAPLALVLDLAAFASTVVQRLDSHVHSGAPILAFATFLLVMAMVRWNRCGVVLTGLALGAIWLVGHALGGHHAGGGFPVHVLTDLLALALVTMLILWTAARQRVSRPVALTEPAGAPGARRSRVLASALADARIMMGGTGAAIAVSWGEEPWVDLLILSGDTTTSDRQGPGSVAEAAATPGWPTLFDMPRQRRITLVSEQRIEFRHGPFPAPLAERCGVQTGIVTPFASVSSQGQLLVWGIPDMAVDDLPLIGAIGRAIGQALDREEMAALAKNAAVAEVRNALARDLHDSVVQFLAGTMFRLDAVRRRLRDGKDAEAEIVAMKQALQQEQAQLRAMIDRLRRGEDGDRTTDIAEELRGLVEEISAHWHIRVTVEAPGTRLAVPIRLAYELRQMIREAVANAARHGHCRAVSILLQHDAATLKVRITDDGHGFAHAAGTPRTAQPRSISERVAALGGHVRIGAPATPDGRATGSGVCLDIELPLRRPT